MRERPRVRALAALCVATVVELAAVRAHAGDPSKAPADASNAASAQALFDDAVKLMEAGRYPEACPKLAASEKLDPGAGTLLNLGTCYEKNGQTASAWATYQEAESTARRAAHDDWADRAHAHVTALEPRLQRLVIAVPKGAIVAGLRVMRDGVEVEPSVWGVAIPIDPGKHDVRATAPDKREWSTNVDVSVQAEGSVATVDVPPLQDTPPPPPPPAAVALVPPPAPEPSPPQPFWTTQRMVATVLAGGGVVAVGVGSGVALAAKSKYDDARNNDCPNHGTACTAAGVQAGQDAHSMATAATVLFVGGLGALAVGAALFAVPLSGESPAPASASLRIAPNVAPGHAGLTLLGAW